MPTKKDISILLVEDNEVDVMGVQRAFRQSNLENPIIVASDGLAALGLLRDGNSVSRPYLILLDLNMPRMDGIEFLQEVRKDNHLKKSVIFVLTTSDAPEDRSKAYDQNIAGYIVKGKTAGGFVDTIGLLNRYIEVCALP
jgi:CheY-like chemotaxis protein